MKKTLALLLGIVIITSISYGAFVYFSSHGEIMHQSPDCSSHCLAMQSQSTDAYIVVLVAFISLAALVATYAAALSFSQETHPVRQAVAPPQTTLTGSVILLE